MASYSMITRKMANVLYRARMDGKIEMTDAAVRMLYQCADAYYIHDDCWTEVEARLKEAVSRAMAGDMAGCQEAVDEACERHDRHWEERTARITPEAVEVEEYEAFDEGEEWDLPDDDWEVFEMTAKAEAQAEVEAEEVAKSGTRMFRYSCDCGSLAIGTPECVTLVGNSVGDGTYSVFVTDREDFRSIEKDFVFVTTCRGKAMTVYDYDCEGAQPLCTLSGRLAVYRRKESGDMAVVMWGDWSGRDA